MTPDALGDRMKLYERSETARRLLPLVPAVARIDGRSFSTLTSVLPRPFDPRLSRLMIDTVRFLVEQTSATVGYTQSDEISLLWFSDSIKREIFFDGRLQKMTSTLAALASVYFVRHLPAAVPELADALPVFDCRVWNVPTREEAANVFLWREQDAAKNSVSMAARAHYPHGALHEKSSREMQAMLLEKNINWNDYPAFFKRGTFVQKRRVSRAFTAEERAALHPQHHARAQPDLVVERSSIVELAMPPFGRVTNRVDVLFDGADPVVADD